MFGFAKADKETKSFKSEADRFGIGGVEPSLHELLDDPMMDVFLKSHNITKDQVWRTVREAKCRLQRRLGVLSLDTCCADAA